MRGCLQSVADDLARLMSAATPVDNKGYQCPKCGRVLLTLASLRLHCKEQHLKQFKLHCPLCQKGYNRTDKLNAHLIGQHHYESPFQCAECNKTFTRSDYLRQHLNTEHGGGGGGMGGGQRQQLPPVSDHILAMVMGGAEELGHIYEEQK